MGVPDLDRFGRALRLRWLWQEWGDDPKPWVGTNMSCNDMDRLLFNASTRVTIGDGNRARFWHHSWLEGEAPRYLAPNLFKLVRKKNRTIHQELNNGNWIRSLRTLITSTLQV
jgi:hypothetical protein